MLDRNGNGRRSFRRVTADELGSGVEPSSFDLAWTWCDRGPQDLWAGERVRRHLHAARPTPSQPGRGGPLPVPRVVSWGRSSNVFLENGARLYLDVGSHPEYATPECDNLEDVVAHDKAGERILEGLVTGAEERLEEEGIRGEIYVFKNNTDSAGNSYGCHENYLVSRHKDFHRTVDVLIPFLVTRQIFVGAGKLTQTPRGTGYTMAQRADHIWEGVSSATTRSRPIINTRDEPHADAERYRRLHVIAGDSNMSEYATFVKVGTMVALLQMIERDVVFRDLTLGEPDPGDPGGLPRHDLHSQAATGQRTRAERSRHPVGVPRSGDALLPQPRVPAAGPGGRRSLGAPAHRAGEGPHDPGSRGRLGDEVQAVGALLGQTGDPDVRSQDVDDGPGLSRCRQEPGALLPDGGRGGSPIASSPTRRSPMRW